MHSMHSVHSMHTAYYWVALCRSDSECNCEWKACASSPPPLTTPSSPHCITLHQSHLNPKTAASSKLWIHHSPDSSIFNCCTLLLEEQFYAVRTFHAPLMVRSGRRALYIAVSLRERYFRNRWRQNLGFTRFHHLSQVVLHLTCSCRHVWTRNSPECCIALHWMQPKQNSCCQSRDRLTNIDINAFLLKIRSRIQSSKCTLSSSLFSG